MADQEGEPLTERLTDRQLEIVRLLIRGYRYADVAEELGIGEQAVKNQLYMAKARTGASRVIELAAAVAVADDRRAQRREEAARLFHVPEELLG